MSPIFCLSILLLLAASMVSCEEVEVENNIGKSEDNTPYESLDNPYYGPSDAVVKAGPLALGGKSDYARIAPAAPAYPALTANYAAYLTGIGLGNPYTYGLNRYNLMSYGAPGAYGYGTGAYNNLGYTAPYASTWGYGNPLYGRAAGLGYGLPGAGYGLPGYAGYRYGAYGYGALGGLRVPLPGAPGALPVAGPLTAAGAPLPGLPAPLPAAAPLPGVLPAAYRTPFATTQTKDGRYVPAAAQRFPYY